MDCSNEDGIENVPNGDNVPCKDMMFIQRSPRSPLSTQSAYTDSLDLAIDVAADNSIEQLYYNICEMQSSDLSPSRRSYLSYGEESRIDSELRYLAGGSIWEVPMTKELVAEKKEVEKDNTRPKSKKFGKKNKFSSDSSKLVFFHSDSETSTKLGSKSKAFRERPPSGKRSKKVARKTHARNGTLEAEYLGPYLLKQTSEMVMSGENPRKALELAQRALKSYENCANGKPNLDLVMCLQVVAAIHCRLGQFTEAIPVLERAIEIPVMDEGQNHALAKFSGCMHLGDTYAMLGQMENSIMYYTLGLEIQRQALGEKDHRLGETCRYVAEAYVQALEFDEAEKLCQLALDIHKENNGSPSFPQEVADRRLMGLICDSKGDYESALEHYVLASVAMAANGQDKDIAAIDCSIGDAYLSLARYDEAIFAYQKALVVFKSTKGDNHPSVASVFVRLADLYNRTGKQRESKSYCESALRIYEKPVRGSAREEIATGLIDVANIYESMNELDHALKLLQKALKIYGKFRGQQSTIAGIEGQMGVLYYIRGRYLDSYNSFKSAISMFRASGEKKSAIFGIALNQMGLTCVQLYAINEAADLFEEAKSILETEYGPYHPDTLGIYSNLAGTYDAMGRPVDAIEILEYVVEMRGENCGPDNLEVEDEKRRLAELLKEVGRVGTRKSISLENYLENNTQTRMNKFIKVL